MVIQHNASAQSSGRLLKTNRSELSKSIEKLASGFQINGAGDNAAGLAISEKMRAEITATGQAKNNVEDGINLVKTAEGSLQEIQDMVDRLKELAVLSSNGTFEDADTCVDRAAFQWEVEQLLSEIDRIAESTNFNGIYLLNGGVGYSSDDLTSLVKEYGSKFFGDDYVSKYDDSVGIDSVVSDSVSTVSMELITGAASVISLDDLKSSATNGTFMMNLNYQTENGETHSISFSDSMVGDPMSDTEALGAIRNALDQAGLDAMVFEDEGSLYVRFNDGSEILNPILAGDTAITADTENITTESINISGLQTGDSITLNGVTYMMIPNPTNGYQVPEGTIGISANEAVGTYTPDTYSYSFIGQLENTYDSSISGDLNGNLYFVYSSEKDLSFSDTITLQIGTTGDSFNQMDVPIYDVHADALGLTNFDVSTQESAIIAIDSVISAVNLVSSIRGDYGALNNRLDHTFNNLGTTEENLQNAESVIRDTDMAAEVMKYTKANMLSGASETMLSHAMELPDIAMQMIQDAGW